jgi:rubrerythrin
LEQAFGKQKGSTNMANQDKKNMSWFKRPTMDEFLHNGEHEHNGEVSFTGAWRCTLCSCPQYVGGDSPSDLCHNCGHQRHKHEYRT